MKLTLAYSPCPNDCFIFDALTHHKVDTEGLTFDVRLEDVETLNHNAVKSVYDITKLSFYAYGFVSADYILLTSGSALGFNCGPLIIARKKIGDPEKEIHSIAIPGKMTTANFLLSMAYPLITNKIECVFSDIEEKVLSGEVDAGLVIHENRFTYEAKGLTKVRDLGEYWESLIHSPIPLGGIAIRRSISPDIRAKVNRVIRRSIEYAFANPDDVMGYVRAHAQEMDDEVMKKHITLYVNNYSVDLGDTGKNAVRLMFSKAAAIPGFPPLKHDLFVE
jgi:1,4-dihydroxy-6-naphthoate synthase